jgi:hypothetical protein
MVLAIRRMRGSVCAALTLVAGLLVAAEARADFVVNLYEGSTLVKSLGNADGAPISFNGTVGDFSVNLKYQLLTGAGGLQAIVSDGQATVTNNDARNTHSLTIYAVDQGTTTYTPLDGGGLGQLSGVLTRESSNSLLAKSISGTSATPPRLTSGPGLIGSGYDVKYGAAGAFTVVSYAAFRLTPDASVMFSQQNPGFNEVSMPAPAGLTLALAGIPCVCCCLVWRRRQVARAV